VLVSAAAVAPPTPFAVGWGDEVPADRIVDAGSWVATRLVTATAPRRVTSTTELTVDVGSETAEAPTATTCVTTAFVTADAALVVRVTVAVVARTAETASRTASVFAGDT
jgi:hypothetical protein